MSSNFKDVARDLRELADWLEEHAEMEGFHAQAEVELFEDGATAEQVRAMARAVKPTSHDSNGNTHWLNRHLSDEVRQVMYYNPKTLGAVPTKKVVEVYEGPDLLAELREEATA